MTVASAAPCTPRAGKPRLPYISSQLNRVFVMVAATVTASGILTSPMSRSELAMHIENVIGMPMKNMMLMYFTASSSIGSASVLPISISESTSRGNTRHTSRNGMNAANPITSLKRKACFIPPASPAPKNWVMNIPPDIHIALIYTINTNSTCPATFTPDIGMSPSPDTIKLSISDTRLWISC